jgi:hypothetical protein
MNCDDTELRIADYLDKNLIEEEKSSVDLHLKTCSHCSSEVNDYQKIQKTFKKVFQSEMVPIENLSGIWEGIETKINNIPDNHFFGVSKYIMGAVGGVVTATIVGITLLLGIFKNETYVTHHIHDNSYPVIEEIKDKNVVVMTFETEDPHTTIVWIFNK